MAERFLCASDSSSGGRAIRVWVRILVKALVSLSKTLKSGCIRLASLCRPHDAHLSGPLTRADGTITHPLVVTSCTSGQPQVTHSTSMALAADRVSPWNYVKAIPMYMYWGQPGRPMEANQTHHYDCFPHHPLPLGLPIIGCILPRSWERLKGCFGPMTTALM